MRRAAETRACVILFSDFLQRPRFKRSIGHRCIPLLLLQ